MKKAILFFPIIFFLSFSYGQNAKKLVKSGWDKYYNDDIKGAISDFDKALELDSNYAFAYSSRGYLKNYSKDYVGAIADYTKSILLDPEDVENYIMNAKIKKIVLDFNGAISDLTKGIEVAPRWNRLTLYMQRGLLKYEINDFEGAISDFSIEIEQNFYHSYPNQTFTADIDDLSGLTYENSFYYRGMAKKNLKDYKGAIVDFTHVIFINFRILNGGVTNESIFQALDQEVGYQLNKSSLSTFEEKSWPNLTNAFYHRGLSNLELKNYEKAIDDFTNVIRLKPEDYAEAYFYRSSINFPLALEQGCFDCIKDFTKAINLKPDLTEAYFLRGLLNHKLKPFSHEAYEDYNKVLILNPNFAEAYLNRGIHMFKYRSRPDAVSFTIDEILDDYNKAIDLKPFYPEAYFHRGEALYEKKEYLGAISDFSKALEQEPNFAEAYVRRGYTYNRLKQNKEACSDIRKAIELGETFLHDTMVLFCK